MSARTRKATDSSASASTSTSGSTAAAVAAEEASKMLEAALQQMDGIISGTTLNHVVSNNSANAERKLISAANVLSTAKTLALALQQVGCNAPSPDPVTSAVIIDWLETHLPRQDTDERLRRLQRDKEALAVQYQTMTDKVAEQGDRILELERQLVEKAQQLSTAEERLQRQVLSQSALETQKLELMTALSELKLHRAALERENVELKSNSSSSSSGGSGLAKIQPFGSMGNLQQAGGGNSLQGTPKTPPAAKRYQVHPQFHSLPRTHAATKNHKPLMDNNANNQQQHQSGGVGGGKRNVAFADADKIMIDEANDMYGSFMSQQNSSPSPSQSKDKVRGLRNIFGKLRRSNSGNLELPPSSEESEFKRGGARATAAGRIEWTQSMMSSAKPYSDWNCNDICNWLCDMGLGCYEEDCRKWLKSNFSLRFFETSPIDIEKELNLKSPLHRKKITLAISELTGKEDDDLALKAGQLDVSWTMRWLDDIGLPQYKDTFLMAKIDGRMLHRLTMEDLAHLHVTSCLHIASLRRGIQCMREMKWDPECLIRRSKSEDDNSNEPVALWTAHRVMEWLKVADLSEYAPNLRGAGVHGALMLYEERFTAELLADLLSIPPSKTLLRRHLATHFKELLGRATIQGKRDAEAQPGYQPLNITAKIKLQKKSQFSLKRRKSTKGSEIEWTDFVCPMAQSELTTTTTPVKRQIDGANNDNINISNNSA
ncbi:liprin-beta-1 [Eupeodes corollae]|uniref:liprin-beta-1 n=1 Tax=Eupeodes corollae TaxID=290404 RepID=UPI0024918519|nr:liprin-beta-1 [Eupeodes corollae]